LQDPDDENEPVPSDWKLTDPPGREVVPAFVSETVAVHVDAVPTAADDGVHTSAVLEVRFATESPELPELPACALSPG
jgi:hypothetical protein